MRGFRKVGRVDRYLILSLYIALMKGLSTAHQQLKFGFQNSSCNYSMTVTKFSQLLYITVDS